MTEIAARISTALADRYTIERELGAGGMATVYLAEDVKHRRKVAVKVLRPELAASLGSERFVREIEIAARLTHPHILPLHDSGEADGFLYYVMPYVEGQSLRELLDRGGTLSVADAVRLTDQVASALSYAHDCGVVHRDVKPENILLAGDQAIVADFGIAHAVEAAGGDRLTATGLAVGTPAYMSPEQATGEADVDGRSDVYALGCVVYEMICGRPPFDDGNLQALLAKHAMGTVPSLRGRNSSIPLFVERAVACALAKSPVERFQTPRAFAEALTTGTVVARVGPRPWRRHVLVGGGVGIVLLVVGALVATLGGSPAIEQLAVMPFNNLTNDPEQEYLVQGMHEGVMRELLQAGVSVIGARASLLRYQEAQTPIGDIARELRVDAVIEASVSRDGDDVRLDARLVDPRTQEHLWFQLYQRDVRSVVELQREVALAIAGEIQLALSDEAEARMANARPVDPDAYERYMRGRVHQQRFTPDDLERAQQYYEAALEIQPDYAPAWAGISLIWGSKLVLGMMPASEGGQQWRMAADSAVALDPNLAEGHQALAQWYTWYDYDWERAEAAYERAIALDPNEPQARIFYSHFLGAMRRVEESDAQILRALEIDPLNPFTQMLRGAQLGCTGRFEEGIEYLADVPASPLRSQILAVQHFALGRMAEGLAHYARYFEFIGDLEMVRALQDDGAGPQAAMIRGAETLIDRASRTFVKPENMVFLFEWAGDVDRAMEWMERSYEMRDHQVAYSACRGVADELRADPRYHAFLERLNLPVPEVSSER